jgi:methylated-DNA-[protein]-cysteine S-methyltransferase
MISLDLPTGTTDPRTAAAPAPRAAPGAPTRRAPWHLSRLDTPLGPVTLAATDRGLAGLWFDGQKHHPGPLGPVDAPDDRGHPPVLAEAAGQLAAYFAGQRSTFTLPLDPHGTPFQQAVWQALLAVPHGRTCSYAQLAAAAGHPAAVRAVAAAIGRNPVSVIVPCHRVIGSGGSLTGYAGGLDRKRALLMLEGALRSPFDGTTPPAASR